MNCYFEKGFKKREKPYNQLNRNDKQGRTVIIFFLFTIINLTLFLFFKKNKFLLILFLILFIINILYLYKYISYSPIRLLYMGGYIINYFTKNSPYPKVNTFFPNNKLFEQKKNFRIIKQEVQNVLKIRNHLPLTKNTFNKQNTQIGSDIDGEQKDNEDGWKILVISTGSTFSKTGLKYCPYLCKLIKQCPEILSCVISILPPKKGIPIHIGYYKGIIRYQLGVIIPKDRKNVYLCANGIPYHWKEGKGMIFDDTFAHKVYNNTLEDRVIIYMDIRRTNLPILIKFINEIFINALLNTPDVKNEIKKTEYQVNLNK